MKDSYQKEASNDRKLKNSLKVYPSQKGCFIMLHNPTMIRHSGSSKKLTILLTSSLYINPSIKTDMPRHLVVVAAQSGTVYLKKYLKLHDIFPFPLVSNIKPLLCVILGEKIQG